MNLSSLSAPFPRSAVHWRVQGKPYPRDGKHSAMALAYIDARDVMDRLDDVCGPEGWQSEFTETAKGRVICRLGIKMDGEWVWKSDGAGDTDLEGEKGGISDALKRAAVSWGIGRYLYRLDSPWVPCEVNDKGAWRRWTADPWGLVKNAPSEPSPVEVFEAIRALVVASDAAALQAAFANLWKSARHVAEHAAVIAAKEVRKEELQPKEQAA